MSASTIAIFFLQAAQNRVASLRIIAAILLVGMLCGLVYVLRRVKTLRVESGGKRLTVQSLLLFLGWVVIFLLTCVLLFYVARAQ